MGGARTGAMVARSVGVVCIALGFVLGMRGLEHPDSIWLKTALGLIVTGLLAQGYALYCTLRRIKEKNDAERQRVMRPLTCSLCGKNSVLQALCRSAGERLIGLVGVSPFRCQLCAHRFLAFRWGRSYPTHLVDRREHPRVPVRLILSFSGERHRGEGTLTDISMGGCLVQSAMPAKVDEIYYLRIHFAEQDPPVELAAIVRSVGARGIGFKFLRSAREDARLAEFLQTQGCGAVSAVLPKTKDNHRR